MNTDDNPHSSNGSSNKGWLEKIVQAFAGEPQNREELADIITEAEQKEVIDPDTRKMIQGVLGVSEMRVRDIMIPRSQMTTIEMGQPLEAFLPIVLETAHSRFPVVSEDKDHVEGVLLAKDLLRKAFEPEADIQLSDIIRPAVIIPESKRVDTLLREFREHRYHMAIVVDEYGGVSGLVTIEDILELIVGEIEDEHDAEEDLSEDIKQLNTYTFSVKALTSVDDFNRHFGTSFDAEDADTIGGIVINSFGHMPEKDEAVMLDNILFRVNNADGRRLIQLKVTLPKPDDEPYQQE
ncbi:HlyC/CorC family transporter [Alteromonas sp. a30]|uniref:HlyC/CorC family transporter n=1 Tax=Alteromonas sp. a30 TaxID=2730917 RepID=UPI00227FD7BF|nr:transporter associated domain-containing protein [Alteromonas sp. a30]MCY7295827.1 CBS domain-containing protein [Alteromonas sp. a30]